MERTRLLLVYPEILSSNTDTSTYSLPLGLGSVATYCKSMIGNELEIKILDGSLINHKEQLTETEKYKPDITGINSTIASQKKGYEVGELAKNLGSKVIFGGVNSTNLWENMLNNRKFIDGVILYDGEIPMYFIINRLKETKILGNDCFKGIPNLAYKDSKGRVQKPDSIYIPNLDDLPEIDYSLFDLDRFFEQTEKKVLEKLLHIMQGKVVLKGGQ